MVSTVDVWLYGMVGVNVWTHMLFQVDLHDLTESALVTASLHVASLSLLGRFFEDLDKKRLIFFFWKRTKRMFFNCQNAPSSSLVGCCNISSWTGFVDFLAFLNLDAENPSRLLETVSQRFSCYLDAEKAYRLCPEDFLAILMLKNLLDCVPKIASGLVAHFGPRSLRINAFVFSFDILFLCMFSL